MRSRAKLVLDDSVLALLGVGSVVFEAIILVTQL